MSANHTTADAGKVMKYSIFPAPGMAERLLEWGGASVCPRAEIFPRGGGSLLGGLSSVCLSVCTPRTPKNPGFSSPENHSFRLFARQNGEFCPAKKSASCAAPVLVEDTFISPNACVFAAEWRRLARGTLWPFYAENRPKRGVPPGRGPQGGAFGAGHEPKSAPRTPPKAPSRPVRRLEK